MADPVLYDTVNSLYQGVMDYAPQFLQERDTASAFGLGGAGSYLGVKALQSASKRIVDKVIPGFDGTVLPALETICAAGMAAAPVIIAGAFPEEVRQVMTEHPTYTSGMLGVWAGSLAGALQHLYTRAASR